MNPEKRGTRKLYRVRSSSPLLKGHLQGTWCRRRTRGQCRSVGNNASSRLQTSS